MIKYVLAAGIAIAYLLVMSNHGKLHHSSTSEHTHLTTAVNGLLASMAMPPRDIEIEHRSMTWRLGNKNTHWAYGTKVLSDAELKVLKDFLAMLRSSEPVRTFLPEDLLNSSHKDYGLEKPALKVTVFPGSGNKSEGEQKAESLPAILKFGNATPDGSLRYVGKEGDPNLYVMSGFVFQQAQKLTAMLGAQHAENTVDR